jgi:hypothetical protein
VDLEGEMIWGDLLKMRKRIIKVVMVTKPIFSVGVVSSLSYLVPFSYHYSHQTVFDTFC